MKPQAASRNLLVEKTIRLHLVPGFRGEPLGLGARANLRLAAWKLYYEGITVGSLLKSLTKSFIQLLRCRMRIERKQQPKRRLLRKVQCPVGKSYIK